MVKQTPFRLIAWQQWLTVSLWLSVVGSVWGQTPQLRPTPYVTGLYHPVDMAAIGPQQLLVAQTNGQVRLVQNGVIQSPVVLDIGPLLFDLDFNGIFGLCVHPQFAQNGYLYVQYFRKTDQAAVVARYTCTRTAPIQASLASAQLIFTVPYPAAGHRSGRITFGPDGYLYISTGDSGEGARGSQGDPSQLAQNRQSPFGKLFRIDVDAATPYAIPPDNPFASPTDGVPDELYALGLRNPWRWSFDKLTGDLWMADIGQDGWEELTVTPAAAPAPQNYGWPCYEGTHPYATSGCSLTTVFAQPLLDYAGYNNNGQQARSITGGFVYRGSTYPSLRGWYVYGDWSQGTLWTLRRPTNTTYQNVTQTPTVDGLVSFGEGTDGQLYALSFWSGTVYALGVYTLGSAQTGNWQAPTTWTCQCVPDATAATVVAATHTVEVSQPTPAQSVQLRGTIRFSGNGALRFQ
ncbi:PQQ-dependent sugar dehydrogenase [Fibrella aestuarina]|uniref:PQQ-dependent sugar dehydrogenase n=1 Tax=Fibrella aestuarina TaxID=651143 RepID=UPI001E44DD27|nr:PQQ-dependent sugar dehydrogenase [Fibrella aestuarina]